MLLRDYINLYPTTIYLSWKNAVWVFKYAAYIQVQFKIGFSWKQNNMQGIFYPSLGAKFRPQSQLKIATFFPITMSVFPN